MVIINQLLDTWKAKFSKTWTTSFVDVTFDPRPLDLSVENRSNVIAITV